VRARVGSAPPALSGEAIKLCAFFAGQAEYAIDIRRVEEIVQPRSVTPLVDAPPFVKGLVELRGAVAPVVDLARRLGGEGGSAARRPKWLVVLIGSRRVVLVVDSVSGVVNVEPSELQPLPALATGPDRPLVIGAFGPAERVRLLLDVKALFPPRPGAAL
jgi:purine-binding chemotaxis protein CheW